MLALYITEQANQTGSFVFVFVFVRRGGRDSRLETRELLLLDTAFANLLLFRSIPVGLLLPCDFISHGVCVGSSLAERASRSIAYKAGVEVLRLRLAVSSGSDLLLSVFPSVEILSYADTGIFDLRFKLHHSQWEVTCTRSDK